MYVSIYFTYLKLSHNPGIKEEKAFIMEMKNKLLTLFCSGYKM